MKTSPLDFLYCSISLTIIITLSLIIVKISHQDTYYGIVLDVLVFLLSYGIFTVTLLAIIRSIRPYPEGEFLMSTSEFTYWKLVAVLSDLSSKALSLFNTVFTQPLIYAAFGTKVGKQCAIAGVLRDHPILYIGDFATIGQNSVITGHVIVHDKIILKPIKIGPNAVVGINCVVMPGVILEEGAVLAPGSVATMDTHIPAYEFWGGTPAHKLKDRPR
jgi:acetyltransferase-like isoleucine patch superfamily enzyme